MCRINKFLMAVTMSLFLSAPALAAEVEIQAGVFGGTLYQMSYAFTEVLNAGPSGLKGTAVETAGSGMGIVKSFAEPEKRIVAGTLVPFLEARKGVEPYKQAYAGLKCIGYLSENYQTLITFNPDIKTLADLKGKRVGLGPKPSVLGKNHGSIVLKAMQSDKDITFFYMDWGSLRDGIMDGSLDAIILGVSARQAPPFVPVAIYGEMVASRGTPHFISIPAEAVEKAAEADAIAYEAKVLPAGSLGEGVPAQDIGSWHDMLGFFAFEQFSEESAYILAKTLHENCADLAKYSAAAKGVWPELVVPNLPDEMIHPGALRYYKEKGLR